MALTDPWDCGPLYLVVHYALSYKCNTPKIGVSTEAFLIQHGAKPGPSGIHRLEDGVASLVLSPLPNMKCWINALPPDTLAIWGAPWGQLNREHGKWWTL